MGTSQENLPLLIYASLLGFQHFAHGLFLWEAPACKCRRGSIRPASLLLWTDVDPWGPGLCSSPSRSLLYAEKAAAGYSAPAGSSR